MKPKIIIGIPSYNEAKNINEITQKIDHGLTKFKAYDCMIVNIDSNSIDNTRSIFNNIKTNIPKKCIHIKDKLRGKGKNLIALFKFAKSISADYVISIDADIKTLTPEWVPNLLKPIITQGYDFCLPLYQRSRFEGNITNHFAYCLIYGFFGSNIRQPIGGDFAFKRKFYTYLLEQPINDAILRYGIDIFITGNSITGGFRSTEVYLGEKIHTPSFYHMIPTFQDVFQSGIFIARNALLENKNLTLSKHIPFQKDRSGISYNKEFKHIISMPNIMNDCIEKFVRDTKEYKLYLGEYYSEFNEILEKKKLTLTYDLWTTILANFVADCFDEKFNIKNLQHISELITPIYLWRAMSYWVKMKNVNASKAEEEIINQSKIFKKKLALLCPKIQTC